MKHPTNPYFCLDKMIIMRKKKNGFKAPYLPQRLVGRKYTFRCFPKKKLTTLIPKK
jgi:hypothetical protein